MKKLLVAFAAMATAVVLNAATVEWTAYPVYDMGVATENTGYLIYFFDSSFAIDNVNAALAAGDTSFIDNGFVADALVDGGLASGYGASSYGNLETITGYLVVFNAESLVDATYAYVSSEASGITGGQGQSAQLSFEDAQLEGMIIASNWQSIGTSVPEPTSALMLLVGLAGLALKRKVA